MKDSPSTRMINIVGADPSSGAAIALGPSNPRVSLVQGMGALFTPPEWGGGPAAEKLFLKSAGQFAADHPALENSER